MSGEAEKRGEKMALKKTKASTIGSSKKTEGGSRQQGQFRAGRTLDDAYAEAVEKIQG